MTMSHALTVSAYDLDLTDKDNITASPAHHCHHSPMLTILSPRSIDLRGFQKRGLYVVILYYPGDKTGDIPGIWLLDPHPAPPSPPPPGGGGGGGIMY